MALLFVLGTISVEAQTTGFSSAEEALNHALSEYMTQTDQVGLWELGEVHREGGYAYSLARHIQEFDTEDGYLMILAKVAVDELWFSRTPTLDSALAYNAWLNDFPSSLLSEFEKSYFYQYTEDDYSFVNSREVVLYRFPWPIRQTARLTQKNGSYHTNQIDFVLRNSNDVYASKPGVVIFKKESSSTGGCNMDLWEYANLIVIQHAANEFSWYYHLAPNSVTVEVGDLIGYGTKIGEQGNTGFACGSSGVHLHFMVSTAVPSYWPNPSNPAYAPWPPSGTIIQVDFVEASWSSMVEDSIYESQNAPPPGACGSNVSQTSFYDGTYCSNYLQQVSGTGLFDLSSIGAADTIESIEIPQGYSAKLYRDENEAGQAVCINATDEMLWDNVFPSGEVAANRISWIRVFSSTNCPLSFANGVLLYGANDFAGDPVWGMVGVRSTSAPEHLTNSIIISSGYSLRIWDGDGLSGNSLCIISPVTDLSEFGWGNRVVESVEFAQGDICGGQGVGSNVPILVSPEHNGSIYGLNAPKLCWSVGLTDPLEFFVELTDGESTYQSGWITNTCWIVGEIAGDFGEYDWKVKSREGVGVESNWSSINHFMYLVDVVDPVVNIISPVDGGDVIYPRTNIVANASDLGGVRYVHFFAWYDDGSGIGHDWHYLGLDDNPSDGWTIIWNLTNLADPIGAVWAYVEDYSGNDNSAFVPQIFLKGSVTFGNDYETRGGDDSENIEFVAPTSFPSFSGTPSANQPEDNGGNTSSSNQEFDVPAVSSPGAVESSSETNAEPVTLQEIQLVSLVNEFELWGSEAVPNLCWQQAPEAVSYKVQLVGQDESVIHSPWIESVCWQPNEIAGNIGEYRWSVRYQIVSGEQSDWSDPGTFFIYEDFTLPEVSILEANYLQDGGSELQKLLVTTESWDSDSGIERIYLLAYFGDGSEAAWHEIDSVKNPSSMVHQFIWDQQLSSAVIQKIWVYAIDHAGNVGSASMLGQEIGLNNPEVISNNSPTKGLIDYAYLNFIQSNTDQ